MVEVVMQKDAFDAPTRQLARSITFPLRDLVCANWLGRNELTLEICYLFY